MRILGKGVISTQGRRLDSLGLSYEELLYLRQSTDCNNDFAQRFHEKGVNSKPLREKLLSVIKYHDSINFSNNQNSFIPLIVSRSRGNGIVPPTNY